MHTAGSRVKWWVRFDVETLDELSMRSLASLLAGTCATQDRCISDTACECRAAHRLPVTDRPPLLSLTLTGFAHPLVWRHSGVKEGVKLSYCTLRYRLECRLDEVWMVASIACRQADRASEAAQRADSGRRSNGGRTGLQNAECYAQLCVNSLCEQSTEAVRGEGGMEATVCNRLDKREWSQHETALNVRARSNSSAASNLATVGGSLLLLLLLLRSPATAAVIDALVVRTAIAPVLCMRPPP